MSSVWNQRARIEVGAAVDTDMILSTKKKPLAKKNVSSGPRSRRRDRDSSTASVTVLPMPLIA
jgi:hypothetical protein